MQGNEEGAILPCLVLWPVPQPTQCLTSGKALMAPGPGLLAQVFSELAAGQEGLPAGQLLHTGRALLTGACHGQPGQPILAAAPGNWGSILAHCRAEAG